MCVPESTPGVTCLSTPIKARIRSVLDDKWEPTPNDITDEFVILSPLLNATFRALYGSNVPIEGRTVFYSQLLDAISFLHSNGIWHRDVKPKNILVKSYDPPEAMLTDFGCASDKTIIQYDWPGTIPYLAPEQAEKRTHGKTVDCWSCGIVGLELILRRSIPSRILPGSGLTDYRQIPGL